MGNQFSRRTNGALTGPTRIRSTREWIWISRILMMRSRRGALTGAGAEGRVRTDTRFALTGFLRPARLPIPPLRHRQEVEGTRTPDRRFWRPLLFQLSYTPSRANGIRSPRQSYTLAGHKVPWTGRESLTRVRSNALLPTRQHGVAALAVSPVSDPEALPAWPSDFTHFYEALTGGLPAATCRCTSSWPSRGARWARESLT